MPELDVNRTKSKWLQEVFFAIGSDAKSENYIHADDGDVWKFLGEVGDWLAAAKH
ncbi:hypothetical protein D3C73_1565170 [compost metagenome]